FRLVYLQERIAAAHLATLALEATPDNMVNRELENELLDHAGAYAITLHRRDQPKLMLVRDAPAAVEATYDLRKGTFFGLIGEAFFALAQSDNRVLRVCGNSPKDPRVLVEVVLDETPMRVAMYDYSERILVLSIVISLMTAALVYLSLQWLMVYPMRRITESMTRFREDPEDATNVIVPSRRGDEVGIAQRVLADMETGLRAALRQKTRLAALGAAVAKINHDLRNILSTAQLVSDRLTHIDDPEVKRIAPTLLSSIDRAVNLCVQTLDFARDERPRPNVSRFQLRPLVDDAGAALGLPAAEGDAVWDNAVGEGVQADADRDQLFRVLVNLGQNAVEAGAERVRVTAKAADDGVAIEIADDGPGLPPAARETLFQPFAGSSKAGGMGLGLAIAHDLVRAHGGDLTLAESGAEGTVFRVWLPKAKEVA
ncbi:MAG: PAS domain-containing sensor histidine kinase, partial [Alphaproteobacteria bacterium]